MAGCEGERDDTTGVQDYFKANPYESAERPEPTAAKMSIQPESVTIDTVGKQQVFTVSGGEGSYHWTLSDERYGKLRTHGENQAIYQCLAVGDNDVIVQDDAGHYASAHVSPAADSMAVSPSEVALSGGALYVAFSVSGGTAPYTWTSGNTSLGTVSYSASSSYTCGYTAVPNAYGKNIVTVRDANGRTASAAITQSE